MSNTHNMSLTRPQRLSVWVVKHLPHVLVSDTERVGLSLAFIAVGLSSLNQMPRTLEITDLGIVNILTWSLSLIIGGIMTIWGMSSGSRYVERFGLVLSSWGCITYAVAVMTVDHADRRNWIIGSLFLSLALIKLLRLVISSAGDVLRKQEPGNDHQEG